MSSEKDFHNLIEQQNSEEKESAWRRLEDKLGEERTVPAPKKRCSPRFMKVLSACASFVAVAAIGLGIGLGIGLNPTGGDDILDEDPPKQTEPVDPPEESPVPDKVIRYCGIEDCEVGSGEFTLKQYAENYQIDLLYLDWYEQTEDFTKRLYKTKETGENVCVKEEFMIFDGAYEGYYIRVFVTDNKTETDFLTWYTGETGNETAVNNALVYSQLDATGTLANFEFGGYRYYLKALDVYDEAYILELAESMLQNA